MDEEKVVEKSIAKLAEALSKAQAVMKAAPKNKVNPYFKSKYADLDCIWETCREPLTKNGLSVVQFATSTGSVVTVTTMLLHSSGESLKSDLTMTAKDATPQSIGSTITYGRRYGLSAMVGVSSDDDDDGNTNIQEVKKTVSMPNPETKTETELETIKEKLGNARTKLGDKDFFKVLGTNGYGNIEDIATVAEAKIILKDCKEVYEKRGDQNG